MLALIIILKHHRSLLTNQHPLLPTTTTTPIAGAPLSARPFARARRVTAQIATNTSTGTPTNRSIPEPEWGLINAFNSLIDFLHLNNLYTPFFRQLELPELDLEAINDPVNLNEFNINILVPASPAPAYAPIHRSSLHSP